MVPTGDPPEVARLGSAKGGWLRRTGLSHLVGILALAFSIFPILFVVSASLNPTGTLSSSTLIPREVSLVNYQDLFDGSFPRWFVNSLVIASLAAAISMLISACAAFAFSRFRFRGRRTGLMGLLLVQMFPQFLAIVAIYLIFANITELWPAIGFNTSAGLIILYLGGALGVNTWLMKGFFDTIPKDLDESAKMDGATHFQVFFGIILPLVAPILAITGLLGFIGAINEFLIASIFLRAGRLQDRGRRPLRDDRRPADQERPVRRVRGRRRDPGRADGRIVHVPPALHRRRTDRRRREGMSGSWPK